ncbi:phasin family protein [Bacillus sp. 1P06AnD]|uniref:phasin family protein n=1 Tax=Bacillus sp. 1P06AnD TaxID=3132208 RepID=UPI0039A39E38
MGLNDEMKKVMLAGIGAVATTYEKSQAIVDTLIKKGEITVEQGKVLNEELKRNVKDSNKANEQQNDAQPEGTADQSSILNQLDQMSEEELDALRSKLAEMEK